MIWLLVYFLVAIVYTPLRGALLPVDVWDDSVILVGLEALFWPISLLFVLIYGLGKCVVYIGQFVLEIID